MPSTGATGRPVRPALCRVVVRCLSTPSPIHSVAWAGSPLSNTDWSPPEEWAIRNGGHPGRASFGSLRSVSGSSLSFSPTRVPPPGLEKTVRPSAASRPDADHSW